MCEWPEEKATAVILRNVMLVYQITRCYGTVHESRVLLQILMQFAVLQYCVHFG